MVHGIEKGRKEKLKVAYTNMNGLISVITELNELNDYDLMGITETKLN